MRWKTRMQAKESEIGRLLGGPTEIPKHPRLLLSQRNSYCTLAAGPHCPVQHLYMEMLNWCRHTACLPSSAFVVRSCSAGYQNKSMDTYLATKHLIYNLFCLKNTLQPWWHKICVSIQPMSDFTRGPLLEQDPIPGTSSVSTHQRLDNLETSVKTKHYWPKQKSISKITPNDIMLRL